MPDSPTDLATWEAWQLGVLAGCIVYMTSVGVVLYLLVAGGSFKRMKEQVGPLSPSCSPLQLATRWEAASILPPSRNRIAG
jgi:hypothetical protein